MATTITPEEKGSKELQGGGIMRSMQPFESFDRLFEDFFSNRWMQPMRRSWPSLPGLPLFGDGLPKVDIIDRDNEVLVRADLPGIEKDDLEVTLTDASVTIRAHGGQEKKEEEGEFYCHEISHGEISRTLNLPADVNSDQAKAVFKDGVLKLTLPKVKESKRKTVKVQ